MARHEGQNPRVLQESAQGDGVALSVTRAPGRGEITLAWEGGQPVFEIFRSSSPVNVTDPLDEIGETSERTWTDTPPPGEIFYYRVTSPCVVDPPERCDGIDNDGDGETDEAGAEESCDLANAEPECVAGSCAIESCETGYGDCDGEASNGCELDLFVNLTHCGECGNACSLPNAVEE